MAYIGKSPTGTGVRQRYYFTATGGETSLSGTDDNGKALTFTDGEYVDLHLNGIQLVQGTDYGVGTANTIDSLSALAADDVVEITVHDVFNFAKLNSEAIRHRWYYTATGSETSITTTEVSGLKFPASAEVDVKLNGISLVQGTDFNTTTANTVGGLAALSAGNVVEIVYYEPFQLADVVSKAAGGTYNGDVTFNGNINAGTIKDATGTNTGLTIDSSGRVIMPVVPAWRVGKTAAQAVTTTSETAVTLDQSSGSNCFLNGGVTLTSNKIVVPVTGIYQVNLVMRVDNITVGFMVTRILKNLAQSNQEETYHIVSVGGGAYNTATLCDVFQANAGDEFSISNLSSADSSYTISNTMSFSGHLIG